MKFICFSLVLLVELILTYKVEFGVLAFIIEARVYSRNIKLILMCF